MIKMGGKCILIDLDGVSIPTDNCPIASNPLQTDSDGDGQGNACDADDDNDGLSDVDESVAGTSPLLADTDGDGFSDGEEVAAGSDPLDDTSLPAPLADGDINDDGQVDAADLVRAMRILNGQYTPSPEEQARWDVAPLVNGVPEPDQQNNLGDYLILQRKVLGIISF